MADGDSNNDSADGVASAIGDSLSSSEAGGNGPGSAGVGAGGGS